MQYFKKYLAEILELAQALVKIQSPPTVTQGCHNPLTKGPLKSLLEQDHDSTPLNKNKIIMNRQLKQIVKMAKIGQSNKRPFFFH